MKEIRNYGEIKPTSERRVEGYGIMFNYEQSATLFYVT